MFIVNSGDTNTLSYYVRYDQIDKFEILDHNSNIINSGLTTLPASGGKIIHNIIYNFSKNSIFTYRAYYLSNDKYYLANQTLIQSYTDDERVSEVYKVRTKKRNSWKSIDDTISTGTTLSYYVRYNHIDKYELLDHNSNIINSGLTTLTTSNGKIQHNITYNFSKNTILTYRSYYLIDGIYYLANQTLIQNTTDDRVSDIYKVRTKNRNVWKHRNIDYNNGNSYVVDDYIVDDYFE